jgi:hypothetical protein
MVLSFIVEPSALGFPIYKDINKIHTILKCNILEKKRVTQVILEKDETLKRSLFLLQGDMDFGEDIERIRKK